MIETSFVKIYFDAFLFEKECTVFVLGEIEKECSVMNFPSHEPGKLARISQDEPLMVVKQNNK